MTSWREIVATPQWYEAVTAKVREPRAFAELVDADGNTVVDRVPAVGGTVDFNGEAVEQWQCNIQLADPLWVPQDWRTDPLHPLAGNQLRLWWGLNVDYFGGWVGLPVGTYDLEDPAVADNGQLSLQLVGRDPLAQLKRSGYGGQTITVGGMSVADALSVLYATVAPRRRTLLGVTTVTLPLTYSLGSNRPRDDADAIAAVAGWIQRTDREGTICADTIPAPSTRAASWQEGRDCPVTELRSELKTSEIQNAWQAKSTSAEIVPPIVGSALDTDTGSATWVGRYGPYWGDTIESDAIATLEAAENVARVALEKNRRPMQTVTVKVPARPDLNYQDLVALSRPRAGVAGDYRVSSWKLDLAGGLMDVTMTARAVL